MCHSIQAQRGSDKVATQKYLDLADGGVYIQIQ
jgi:hypothetical protein